MFFTISTLGILLIRKVWEWCSRSEVLPSYNMGTLPAIYQPCPHPTHKFWPKALKNPCSQEPLWLVGLLRYVAMEVLTHWSEGAFLNSCLRIRESSGNPAFKIDNWSALLLWKHLPSLPSCVDSLIPVPLCAIMDLNVIQYLKKKKKSTRC